MTKALQDNFGVVEAIDDYYPCLHWWPNDPDDHTVVVTPSAALEALISFLTQLEAS